MRALPRFTTGDLLAFRPCWEANRVIEWMGSTTLTIKELLESDLRAPEAMWCVAYCHLPARVLRLVLAEVKTWDQYENTTRAELKYHFPDYARACGMDYLWLWSVACEGMSLDWDCSQAETMRDLIHATLVAEGY